MNKEIKVFIKTYGCQMNVADSEWMRRVLADKDYTITDSLQDADVVLLNTCSVRSMAEQKVWSKLGQLGLRKKKKKNLIIGVTGCMAQNYGKEIFSKMPFVNIVCGSYRFGIIPDMLDKVVKGTTHVLDIEKEDSLRKRAHLKKVRIATFVPIMRGCNNKCSYCIVPYVRGPERSRPLNEIVTEIRSLVKDGYKEVTLLGQNVNSYRSEVGFLGLLEEVNKIEGLLRVRFVTSHPKDTSHKMLNAIVELGKVCEYLHLPIQSGSNSILKKMNRGYTREHYFSLINDFKNKIAFSTDIIVGFPEETEKDFENTYNLMKEIEFDSAFIFKYSPRKDTSAARLKDNVPIKTKKERNNILLKLQDEISLKKNKELISSIVEILVEGVSKNNKDRLMGRTRNNKIVVFTGSEDLIGSLVNIRITDSTPHTLYGEKVSF